MPVCSYWGLSSWQVLCTHVQGPGSHGHWLAWPVGHGAGRCMSGLQPKALGFPSSRGAGRGGPMSFLSFLSH